MASFAGIGVLVYTDRVDENLEKHQKCYYLSGFNIDVDTPKPRSTWLLLNCSMTHKFETDLDACGEGASAAASSTFAYQGNSRDCTQ